MDDELIQLCWPEPHIGEDTAFDTAGPDEDTTAVDIMRSVAVTAQTEALQDLSPPARAILTALDSGLGAAAGLGAPLSTVATEAVTSVAASLSETIGSTVSELVGNVVEIIPIVGPVIKGLISIISFAANLGPDDGAQCQQLFERYKPPQTGSLLGGGSTVPADLFARSHRFERSNFPFLPPCAQFGFVPFIPTRCRSALGMALMLLTEGTIFDVRELGAHKKTKAFLLRNKKKVRLPDTGTLAMLGRLWDVGGDSAKAKLATVDRVRAAWGASLKRDARIAAKQWARRHPRDKRRGLPPSWTERFRRLRRGIESSWRKKGSDGGAALWVAYHDLLVAAFDRGYLSAAFARFLFRRQAEFATSYTFWNPSPNHWLDVHVVEPLLKSKSDADLIASDDDMAAPPTWIWRDDPCPKMVVDTILHLVTSWRHTIRPYYAQGQAKVHALTRARHRDTAEPRDEGDERDHEDHDTGSGARAGVQLGPGAPVAGVLIRALRDPEQRAAIAARLQYREVQIPQLDLVVETPVDAIRCQVNGEWLRMPVSYRDQVEAYNLLGMISPCTEIADAIRAAALPIDNFPLNVIPGDPNHDQHLDLVKGYVTEVLKRDWRSTKLGLLMGTLVMAKQFGVNLDREIARRGYPTGAFVRPLGKLWVVDNRMLQQGADEGAANYGPLQGTYAGGKHNRDHIDYSQLLVDGISINARRISDGSRVNMRDWYAARFPGLRKRIYEYTSGLPSLLPEPTSGPPSPAAASYSDAPALLALRGQLDMGWPKRSKKSDGIRASAQHAAQNPTSQHASGDAIDITADEAHGPNLDQLAQALLEDARTHYVIWRARIANSSPNGDWKPGEWRAYPKGKDPHERHLHVSIYPGKRNDASAWVLAGVDAPGIAWQRAPQEPLAPPSVASTPAPTPTPQPEASPHVTLKARLFVEGLGELGLDDYVARVVSGEMGSSPEPQALAAQAIAARTYVQRAMRDDSTLGTATKPVPNSQRFMVAAKTEPRPRDVKAARDTTGGVMLHKGRLILANFVAGARWPGSAWSGKGGSDLQHTEHHVTYNRGKRGASVVKAQPPLASSAHRDNRGVFSQNGADELARRGFRWPEILRYFYGEDVNFTIPEFTIPEQPLPAFALPKSPTVSTAGDDFGLGVAALALFQALVK